MTFIKRIDKEMMGQGAKIGKSCSGALEAPGHYITIFRKRVDKEMISFG